MRALRVAPLAIAVAVLLCVAPDAQARYRGNLNLFVGEKWMNSGDWEPLDNSFELGLALAFGEERAAVHFAMDLFLANDEVSGGTAPSGALAKVSSAEFGLGVRKVWIRGATRPHLGAGADVVQVREDRGGTTGTVTNSDRGYGVWVDAGVTWRLARHLNLGIEARYSSARVDLGSNFVPRDVAGGGIHLGALIGYGW